MTSLRLREYPGAMNARGELRIDPGSLDLDGDQAAMQFAVIHSERSITAAVLARAADLVSGLHASILLLAVHTVPFPASFASASASHAHLVAEVADLAAECPLPVTPHVVMARYREEGFRWVLQSESTVLVGARKRPWQTHEERLARALAKDGHKVILLHVAADAPLAAHAAARQEFLS